MFELYLSCVVSIFNVASGSVLFNSYSSSSYNSLEPFSVHFFRTVQNLYFFLFCFKITSQGSLLYWSTNLSFSIAQVCSNDSILRSTKSVWLFDGIYREIEFLSIGTVFLWTKIDWKKKRGAHYFLSRIRLIISWKLSRTRITEDVLSFEFM